MKPIAEIIADIKDKRVLVIGDMIADITTRVSPLKKDDLCQSVGKKIPFDPRRGLYDQISFGGAACVARNCQELGAKVDFVTLVGGGEYRRDFEGWASHNLPRGLYAIYDPSRPLTSKHRYYWEDGAQAFRADTVENGPVSRDIEDQIADKIKEISEDADVIIVADYRHGMLTEGLAKTISVVARAAMTPLYIASQVSQSESNHHWYDPEVGCFVMNVIEHELSSKCIGCHRLVTQGARGVCELLPNSSGGKYYPGIQFDVTDPTGAGDAFLAAYALSKSPEFANVWAGLSCEVLGANPPTIERLNEWATNEGK